MPMAGMLLFNVGSIVGILFGRLPEHPATIVAKPILQANPLESMTCHMGSWKPSQEEKCFSSGAQHSIKDVCISKNVYVYLICVYLEVLHPLSLSGGWGFT